MRELGYERHIRKNLDVDVLDAVAHAVSTRLAL
jgi:hypothetical protein